VVLGLLIIVNVVYFQQGVLGWLRARKPDWFGAQTEAPPAKLAKAEFGDQPDVMAIVSFLERTKRGICRSVGKEQENEE